jgi:quinol monooxygenase YgiN
VREPIHKGRQMSDNKVSVIAQAKARKGMEEALREKLLSLVEPAHAETGCIKYDLYQARDNTTLFMFYECWKSKDDLEKHLQKPYIKSFMETADELLAEPVTVSLWEKISK